MTVHVFGSINIDHVYRLPRFPGRGETLADTGYASGLGGKGANQALAARAAGAEVRMIGAVGTDGAWAEAHLAEAGIETSAILRPDAATGHAVIYVTPEAENQIVIHGGANLALTEAQIGAALEAARPGDWWLCQNETNLVAKAAARARAAGLKIAYAAAPFEAETAARMMPLVDLLAVNAAEATQLAVATGQSEGDLDVPALLVTRGAEGAVLYQDGTRLEAPAHRVEAVDTTGAGDTFLGTFVAGLDLGREDAEALTWAAAAAALQVTRPGAGNAIPSRAEVASFLEAQP
ncbi:MAG: PfkB family carbohydrate kinase [Pseudomonadota bacterium]